MEKRLNARSGEMNNDKALLPVKSGGTESQGRIMRRRSRKMSVAAVGGTVLFV